MDVNLAFSQLFKRNPILETEASFPARSQDVTQCARSLFYSVITLFINTGNVL